MAVTDPLQIIATPLEYVPTHQLLDFLKKYFVKEEVECVVLGHPKDAFNRNTDSTWPVEIFARHFAKAFPDMKLVMEDERFTTKIALQTMISGGTTKAYRKEKGNIDKVSATIILQSYLERKQNGFG